MRLIVDSCVARQVDPILIANGHDVIRLVPDPGDHAILEESLRTGSPIVTLDKDFGELAVLGGLGHAGIVRLVGIPTVDQGLAVVACLMRYDPEVSQGAILTVYRDRVRVRTFEEPGP